MSDIIQSLNIDRNNPLEYNASFILTALNNINVPNKDGMTPLIYAVHNNINVDMIKFMIESGANVNATDNLGKSVLMYALCNQNKDTIELLIKHGANIHAVDKEGSTIFIYATLFSTVEIMKYLKELGCDPHKPCDLHLTPLIQTK